MSFTTYFRRHGDITQTSRDQQIGSDRLCKCCLCVFIFPLTLRQSLVVIFAGDSFQIVGTAPGLIRRDTPDEINAQKNPSRDAPNRS